MGINTTDAFGKQLERHAHHCVTPAAPSIHDDELKNMPWWWRVMGLSMPFVAWTRRSSVAWTSSGGGLHRGHGGELRCDNAGQSAAALTAMYR